MGTTAENNWEMWTLQLFWATHGKVTAAYPVLMSVYSESSLKAVLTWRLWKGFCISASLSASLSYRTGNWWALHLVTVVIINLIISENGPWSSMVRCSLWVTDNPVCLQQSSPFSSWEMPFYPRAHLHQNSLWLMLTGYQRAENCSH